MRSRRRAVLHYDSWDRFRDAVRGAEYASWAFRGQASAEWPLYSSLSRYLITYGVHAKAWEMQETRILRIFKRKAHLLLGHLPDEEDSFEWLALMQHHGAPTRLLDFTWSPFVAAFFALERATETAAVWGLFPPRLSRRPTRTIRASQRVEKGEVAPWVKGGYEKYFLPNRHRLVVLGEPDRMNQRLVAQSGTFAMAGVLDAPFDELVPPDAVVKFVLDARAMRRQAMAELYQMNINHASLFPGLDGLGRSLGYELESHWAFDPTTMERRPGFLVE